MVAEHGRGRRFRTGRMIRMSISRRELLKGTAAIVAVGGVVTVPAREVIYGFNVFANAFNQRMNYHWRAMDSVSIIVPASED